MIPHIGFGYDVHRLKEGEELWLGGIRLEHSKGTVAHSDGDVLIHAVCDALLGAANLRDIGFHFPDTSTEYKNIDSKILLSRTVALLKKKKYRIGNVDITVCLQRPKIKDHIELMRKTLANLLTVSEDNVSVKATTTEQLGFVGREEGISCYAVALIFSI